MKKKCPKCGNIEESRFCTNCGQDLSDAAVVKTCTKCGAETTSNFCVQCGTRINQEKALNITYTGSYKNGYEPTPRDFKVEVVYKNGKRSVAEVFDLHAPKQLKEKDNDVIIECHGIKKRLHLIESKEENSLKNDTRNDSLEKRDTSPFIDGGQQA